MWNPEPLDPVHGPESLSISSSLPRRANIMLARLLHVAERRPQMFAMGTSAPCVLAGDLMAQQLELKFDGKPTGEVDGRRCGSVFCWAVRWPRLIAPL